MATVLMTDPATGRVALYDEPVTTGDQFDPNSARNAPLNSPFSWISKLRFHSDFDYMELLAAGTTSVTHAQINGVTPPANLLSGMFWDAGGDSNALATYSDPGYTPFALAAAGDNIIWPGMPVDSDGVGGGRYASLVTSPTGIKIVTSASIGSNNLPAKTIDYSYLVFKQPPAASGSILIDFDPGTGIVSIGLGKWSSDRQYLMIAPDGSPLGFSSGRTIDLSNGAIRAWRPDGPIMIPFRRA